jgi:hypothetical protein
MGECVGLTSMSPTPERMSSMDHDPLCPAPRDWWRTCVCDLLEQARADERAKSLI